MNEYQTNDSALQMVFNTLSVLKPYFDDPLVQEIDINGPNVVSIEIGGEKKVIHCDLPADQIESAISILAGRAGKTVRAHSNHCTLNERWPGYRVCAVLPPIAIRGPSMAIRKHSSVRFSLEELRDQGSFEEDTLLILKDIIRQRKNILIVGGTSSGKTTFLKAMIKEINPSERILTIEDLPELEVDAPDVVAFETREDLGVSYTDLLKLGLRYNPDRIILGEVRDEAALDLLNAANTGHDGCIATLHANSSYEGLSRFEDLVMQSKSRIPLSSIQRRISTAFHYVIFMGKVRGKRKLLELLKLESFDMGDGQYVTTEIFKEVRHHG